MLDPAKRLVLGRAQTGRSSQALKAQNKPGPKLLSEAGCRFVSSEIQ